MIEKVKVVQLFVADDERIASSLEISPPADEDFEKTYCPHCRLYTKSRHFKREFGFCSGPAGYGETIHMNFPNTPNPADQNQAIITVLKSAACGIGNLITVPSQISAPEQLQLKGE